jgi:molecular chaperone IbpA
MRSYDFSPLLRATVGFDRMMQLIDNAARVDEGVSYPPYNIEKSGEDSYRITMAVAGFAEDELNVTVQESALLVEGHKSKESEEGRQFLHRGIATRSFQRSFQLADHIRVTGAKFENGLLHIELAREVPEAKKPRTIAIDTVKAGKARKVLENAAA